MKKLKKILALILAILIIYSSVQFIFLRPKSVLAADILIGMNEGYGTSNAVNDANGAISAGSITNATWKTEDLCRSGKCLYFDGTGDYVSFSDASTLDAIATDTITLEGWFRTPDITSGQRTLIAKHNATAGGYKVYIDSNGYLIFGIDSDSTWTPSDTASTSTTAFDDNKWHMFSAIKNGTSSISLYVDGVLYQTDSSITSGSLANADTFYIGIDGNGSSNGYSGFLDEVRILRTAKTADQIKADYLAATQSTTGAPPVAHWKMDESSWTNDCATDSVFDSSGNTNHGDSCPNSTGPTGGAAGKLSNAGNFDGSDDYIIVPDHNSLDLTTNFTISAWINPDTLAAGEYYIVSKDGVGTDTTDSYNFYAQAGDRICYETNNRTGSNCSVSGALPSGVWSHVAVAFNDAYSGVDKATLYVNGVKQAHNDNDPTQAPVALSTNLLIGRRGNSGSQFDGKIDDVRIYNYTRSQTQILEDMQGFPTTGASVSFGTTQDHLNNGLIGYWKMDENTGTTSTADSSGNGKTGTFVNIDSTDWVAGKFGSNLDFDGSTEYITVASPSLPTSDYTYSAWVNLDANSDETIFEAFNAAGSADEFSLGVTTSGAAGRIEVTNNDGSSFRSTNSISTGSWSHVAATRQGSLITIYINGSPDPTTNTDGTSLDFGSCSLVLGADVDNAASNCTSSVGNYTDGRMDELRIYNRALTPAEIQKLYTWAPSPIMYFPFDENAGTSTVYDTSGNGYTGTLEGSMTANNWAPGKFGSGMKFDGTDDKIQTSFAQDIDGTSFSVGAWVKMNIGATGFGHIFGQNAYANPTLWENYSITVEHQWGHVAAYRDRSGTSSDWTSQDEDLTNGVWAHVMVTYDGSSSTNDPIIYVNGIPRTFQTDTNGSGTYYDSTRNWYIGGQEGNQYFFSGTLDDLKLYNYIRTPTQVIEDMNGGHPAPSSPVGSATSYWKFDEGNGTTAYDNSANANNLTLSSASWTPSGKYGMAWNGTGSVWVGQAADDADHDFTASQDFTLSTWVRSDSATNPSSETQYILKKGTITNTGTVGYAMYANTSGNIVFGIKDDTAWGASSPTTPAPDDTVTSTTDLYDGQWHHIVATKNGTSRIDLYVDGKLNASDTSLAATGTLANNQVLRLGDDDADATNAFAGNIDEVKIYRQALNETQVMLEYNRGLQAAMGAASQGSFDEAKTSGNTAPTNGANDTSYGSIAWSNPTNIYASENTRASVTLSGTTATNYLSASSFGFSIPTDATIVGITASIERVRNGGTTGVARDNVVRLVKGGTVIGDNKAATGTNWPTTEAAATYGSSTDLWGTTWTPSDINASNFGLVVAAAGAAAGADRVANVDQILINVAYTTPITSTSQSQAQEYCVPGDSSACNPPIGHWKFDENTGTSTTADSSGNNYAGTLNGTMTADDWVQGKLGSALDFDAVDDSVQNTSISLPTGDFTYSVWIYPTSFGSDNAIISAPVLTSGGLEFQIDTDTNGDIDVILDNGVLLINGTNGLITTNNWYHVAVTRIGSTVTSYINGIVDGTGTDADALSFAACGIRVGRAQSSTTCSSAGNDIFAGRIDDVRVYSYGRTAAQIALDYNAGKPMRWYKMDEASWTNDCSTDSVFDSSGNARHGDACPNSTGPVGGSTGKLNNAGSFDGVDDAVTISANSDMNLTTGGSIAAWIYPNSTGENSFGRIIDKSSDTSATGGYYMATDANKITVTMSGGNNCSTATNSIPYGQWSHVMWTFDSTAWRIYINGKLDPTSCSYTNLPPSTSLGVTIGNRQGATDRTFDGLIDDVRVYNYPVTATQAKTIMNEGAVRFGPQTGSP